MAAQPARRGMLAGRWRSVRMMLTRDCSGTFVVSSILLHRSAGLRQACSQPLAGIPAARRTFPSGVLMGVTVSRFQNGVPSLR